MFLSRLHTTVLTAVGAIALLVGTVSWAGTLVRLEEIASRFPTLRAFLNDPAAVAQYRESLKLYMNQDGSFDRVFGEFIRQISILDAEIPGFGEKAWRLNPGWQQEIFTIEAEKAASGLEIRRTAVFKAINRIKSQVKNAAKETTPQSFEASAQRLMRRYELLPRQALSGLSPRQQRTFFARLDSQGFAQNRAVKKLTNYLAYQVLVHDESLQDALFSGDADLMLEALKKLKRPSHFEATLSELGFSSDLLPYLELSNAELDSLLGFYTDGLRAVENFRSFPEVPVPPELLADLAEFHEQGIEESEWKNLLSKKSKTLLRDWKLASGAALKEKRKALAGYRKANPYFTFETFFDELRRSIRLTADARGRTIRYVPTPRPFHTFFGGRKSKECISGRDEKGISPKRFARSALEGSRSWFTELADLKMEGLIGVTVLEAIEALDDQGHPPLLHALDFASRASKSRVLVTGASGRVSYFIFDILVDKLTERGVTNLVVGDGFDTARNVSAEGVIVGSASYREGRNLGDPGDYRPVDRMSDAISDKFPQVLHGYGDGGMVYAGARGDGHKLVRLSSRTERAKVTKSDLEREIYSRIIQGLSISDSDSVWKVARENNLVMESAQAYRRKAKHAGEGWVAAARALLNDPDAANDALFAFQRTIRAHGRRPDLIAADMIERAATLLATSKNEARAAAAYLTAVYQTHPDQPGLMQKQVLQALEPALEKYNEYHVPARPQVDLLAALMVHQSTDPELFSWLQKNYQLEFGGQIKDAMGNAFSKALKDPNLRDRALDLLSRIVQSEDFEVHPYTTFDWLLSVALAGENADRARSAQVLASILSNRPGTKAARMAAKMVYMHNEKIFADTQFITPELVAGLTQNIAYVGDPAGQADQTAGTASSALAQLMNKHPTLSRLVTDELLAALYLEVTERKREKGHSCKYLLSEILSSHTALLKASHRPLYEYCLNAPDGREGLQWRIFSTPEMLSVVLADNPPQFVVEEVKRRAATPGCADWVLAEAAKL